MYCRHKRPIFLKDLHIEKVLVSSVVKNYKYFIGQLFNHRKAKPLHIMLPKKSALSLYYKQNQQKRGLKLNLKY